MPSLLTDWPCTCSREEDPDRREARAYGLTAERRYPSGVEIFPQGQVLDEVTYIESGWVKLAWVGHDGREVILELALPRTWLGTAAAIANLPTPVSAVTCTSARLRTMPASRFRDRVQRDRAFSLQLHAMHAHDLCRQSAWLAQSHSLTSRQRLERIIRHFIVTLRLPPSDMGIRLNIPLRRRELAQLIGVSPEHLSRLLREMQREGLIRRDKGWVIVPDTQRLCPDAPHGDAPWCEVSVPALTSARRRADGAPYLPLDE